MKHGRQNMLKLFPKFVMIDFMHGDYNSDWRARSTPKFHTISHGNLCLAIVISLSGVGVGVGVRD
jgi:hypothetical protein